MSATAMRSRFVAWAANKISSADLIDNLGDLGRLSDPMTGVAM